jgi:hypothetical protein
MNRYILIRRLTGPSILLLLGVVALLHQADLVSWNIFLPLFLILIGVLKLAQRAALAAAGDEAMYPGMYPGAPYPYGAGAAPAAPQTAQTGGAIVPAPSQELGNGPEGGRS